MLPKDNETPVQGCAVDDFECQNRMARIERVDAAVSRADAAAQRAMDALRVFADDLTTIRRDLRELDFPVADQLER